MTLTEQRVVGRETEEEGLRLKDLGPSRGGYSDKSRRGRKSKWDQGR